jgi:hypothetical protein
MLNRSVLFVGTVYLPKMHLSKGVFRQVLIGNKVKEK